MSFVLQMKTGPFAEHSNQLWNISAVLSWSKVNQGLIRMYRAEVRRLLLLLLFQLRNTAEFYRFKLHFSDISAQMIHGN